MGVRKARINAGLTQQDVANFVGVTQGAVAQWESYKRIPRPQKLVKLAELFSTSVDELLNGGVDDEKRPSVRK